MTKRLMQWRYYPWLLWFLGASLFFSEYFVRTSSGVMVGDLMKAFATDALGLGLLSGFFYWPYVLMQVPVGALVDRYGAHRLLTIMAFVFTFGSYLFAHTEAFWVAEMARFFMGVSASFAFVGTLKLATLWFPSKHFGLLAGMTQGLGMVGAAVGEGPVSHLVATYGWRSALGILSTILLALSCLILLIMRDHPAEKKARVHVLPWWRSFAKSIRVVLRNPQVLWNALVAGLLYAPTLCFAELWGVSYLEQVNHLSYHAASHAVSLIFVGWAIGGPAMGWLSDRIQKRKPFYLFSLLLSFVFLLVVLYMHSMSYWVLCVLLFVYGLCNAGLVIVYALSGEINAKKVTGLTLAVTNMASVVFGSVINLAIGAMLNQHWDGLVLNGQPIYSAQAFQSAFALMPVLFVLGLIVSYLVKETGCRRLEERL